MSGSSLVRRAWRGARRIRNILRWGAGALPALAASGEPRRLLVVYDFSSQPFSVGDILILQVAALVVREQRMLDRVDFALVYEPARPVVPDPAFAHIAPASFLFHLAGFLPAAQVNPHLGAVLLFDSHRHLEAYIADNGDRYHVWPGLGRYAARDYLFYECLNGLFFEHFQRTGALPAIGSRPAAAAWANAFLAKLAPGRVAVSVQLRRNPVDTARNSDLDSWIAFFEACGERFPATFFIVCSTHEIDPRLRALDNVVVVKDHGTTVEHDLALIEAAAMHMGAASGPGTMAQFGRKPYCMFNMIMNRDSVRGFVTEGHRHRFYFSLPTQSWIEGPESPGLLMSEFEVLWAAAHCPARDARAA